MEFYYTLYLISFEVLCWSFEAWDQELLLMVKIVHPSYPHLLCEQCNIIRLLNSLFMQKDSQVAQN